MTTTGEWLPEAGRETGNAGCVGGELRETALLLLAAPRGSLEGVSLRDAHEGFGDSPDLREAIAAAFPESKTAALGASPCCCAG